MPADARLLVEIERRLSELSVPLTAAQRMALEGMGTTDLIRVIWNLRVASNGNATSTVAQAIVAADMANIPE